MIMLIINYSYNNFLLSAMLSQPMLFLKQIQQFCYQYFCYFRLMNCFFNYYNFFIHSIIQMDFEGLENIIDILNKNQIHKTKKTKQKNTGQKFQTVKQNMNQNQPDQENGQIQQILNFQDLYQKRLQKVQKKNTQKEQKAKKIKQMQDNAKKLHSDVKIISKDQPIKLPTIRHLVFKPWSGNHLSYQVNDNGYKFKFTNGVVALVKHLLQQNGFIQSTDNQATLLWGIGVVQPPVFQSMGAYMKVNHFPKTYEITRKDLMLQNLSRMRAKFAAHYNFYPKTFILPNQSGHFLQECQKSKKNNQWYIVKPSNKSQGKGIWLSNKPQEILQKQKQSIVVSQYIHNPLLVNNLKFDMRIYVGITCYNPLRIYIFEDGLTRFATTPYSYDLNSKQDLFAHLTNYSLNKFSQNFVANDDQDECKGHKWSLHALKQYLSKNGYDISLIWSRIQDLIIKTIVSIQNTVSHAMEMYVPYRDNCFQILGFDVLLDQNLRPWLLEINLSPSLNTDSSLDLKIKGNMLADMFTMMGMVSNDQRFSVDKSYILNGNKASNKQMKNDYLKLQKLVIKESQQQAKRSGGWKRIFPTQTASRYKQFFDVDRPFNRLLREQQLKKYRQSNPGVNINQLLKNINQNPQNDKKTK